MTTGFSKNRLEAFSDGVIAIIITIMVLEMKAPHGTSLEALWPLLPVFKLTGPGTIRPAHRHTARGQRQRPPPSRTDRLGSKGGSCNG
jgi:hypothetical protein